MNKLIITDDEGKTTVVPLVRDEITIGRKEGNTIRLTERNISRAHARLLRSNGAFTIEDLVSYNGVKVNGVVVDGPRQVKDGDRITIGDYQLSLRSERLAAVPVPTQEEEPPPYPRLVMLGPPEAGKEFLLDQPKTLIGRTDENAIVINHRSISRTHAKVEVKGDKVRLYDLESANGIRVNGDDYDEVELRRGDLVEFGTVRLRFVVAGEAYQFDADATVQMDAVPDDVLAEVGRKPGIPLFVLIAVVAVLGIGILIALVFLIDPDEPRITRTDPETPPGTKVQPTASGPTPEAVKERARDLIEQEDFQSALAVLASLGPTGDIEVQQLRSQAALEQESHQYWKRACQDADPSDLQGVYLTCKGIKAESRFYRKGCCEKAADRFAEKQLGDLETLFESREYQQVASLAGSLSEDEEISGEIRKNAKRYLKRAEDRLETKVALSPEPDRSKTPRPPGNNPKTVPRPPEKTPPAAASEDRVSQARDAYMKGDFNRCISLLRSSSGNKSAASVLIGCYQKMGDTASACKLAKSQQNSNKAIQTFYLARCKGR
jgi:pSer/pThr/pTyr-binding forkhead associated (FHA) protein